MASLSSENIKKIVREVINDLQLDATVSPGPKKPNGSVAGPRALIIFHSGVFKLDVALTQVHLIESIAGKTGVFTAESARASICGDDVKMKAEGSRCILDSVRPDGLEKVLEKADILVLPTFCMQVASKVANLTCDDQGSGIVLSALLRGKKVLAARDGFMTWKILSNEVLREAIEQILKKLENFGMVFCKTEELSATFRRITSPGKSEGGIARSELQASEAPVLSLVTAKDINRAVENKEKSVRLARGGKVTPLAKDLAKEYSIVILET
jgi:hypothetical protein